MKAPGIPAKMTGKRLERGRALQIMTYPRIRAKRAIVGASRETGLSVSSFMLLASVEKAAALRGCDMADLVGDELLQYRKTRRTRKRSGKESRSRDPS